MSFIEELSNATPIERQALLQKRYKKNLAFFCSNYPKVYEYLIAAKLAYHIEITDSFLNILNNKTKEVCHPNRLDFFAELLGDWVHHNWLELQNFSIPYPSKGYSIHRTIVDTFHRGMLKVFPEFENRYAKRQVFLPDICEGKKYSPPVAFIGIFHGLHIDYYLSRTELDSALFIEPDIERFQVSCYFLDYDRIQQRFGKLFLVIGSCADDAPLRNFLTYGRITPVTWLRVLPGYASEEFGPIISSLRLLQQINQESLVPIDIDLEGIINGWKNLRSKLPLLSKRPNLSKQSQIAVVAPGPSMWNDIGWLKQNRENLIIFAVHGAVMPLKNEGITPDFQFALEIHEGSLIKEVYHLDPELPLVLLYYADEVIKEAAKNVLIVGTVGRHNIVKLACPVPFAHPSTGSFAVAVALMCNPSHLYLIGLDLGFRDQAHTHVKDSQYELDSVKELEKQYQKTSDTSPVAGNFPANGPVFSKPFYNQARISIESAIDYWINQKKIDCKVYNFSDGAKINGAKGERSSTHQMAINKHNIQDKKEITSAFQEAEEGYNWSSFTLHGKELLEEFKNTLLDKLTLETFTLVEFSKALDSAPTLSIEEINKNDPGSRMECYLRAVIDLMQNWYRFMLFCNTQEESERIYKEGIDLMKKSISQLEWPEE